MLWIYAANVGGSIVALVGVALALMTKRQRWTRNPCRIVSQPSAEDVVNSRAANNVRRVMQTGADRCSGAAAVAGEGRRGCQ